MTFFFFFNKFFIEKCKEISTENPGFAAMWVPIQFGYFIYFILLLFVFCFHCFDFISLTVKDENKIEKNDN